MKNTSPLGTLPQEFSAGLAHLRSKKSIVVRKESHVDAAEALDELNRLVDRLTLGLTAASASKLAAEIDTWLRRQRKRAAGSLRLSDKTISAIGRLLLSATRIYFRASGRDSPRKTRGTSRQVGRFLNRCLATLVSASAHSEDVVSWAHPVEYARSASEITGQDFSQVMSPGSLGETFETLLRGMTGALEEALDSGETREADFLVAALGSRGELQRQLVEALRSVLRERAALLPVSSQDWLVRFLRLAPEAGRVEHVRPSDAPEIRQAAGLLLFLRDRAADSPVLSEAFQRFQSLCEKHFGLVLRGQIGATVDYDSRVHEPKGAVSTKVRLIRPWVEWVRPPHSSIVIRALVADAQAPTGPDEV